MRNKYRQQYVGAIIPVIESRCRGKALPICLDARQLLEEACKREGLVHSYNSNESYRVVKDLFDEIDRQCKGHEHNEIFPVAIIKCTSRIVKTIGHGRELVVNDKTTSAWYEQNAYASRSDGFTGFVLFSKQVTTAHPILRNVFTTRYKANSTERMKLDQKFETMKSSGLITAENEMSFVRPAIMTELPLLTN